MMRSTEPRIIRRKTEGFTLIELLVGSAIMLVVIIAALGVYSKSNQISVDQAQYSELQHDVRSAMYIVMRDTRMAGAGFPQEFAMYSLAGTDNENQGVEVTPDRLRIMGNIEDPLNLKIMDYQGSSENVTLEDYSFEQYPYPDSYYDNKLCFVLPNPASHCPDIKFRWISQVIHNQPNTNEGLGFAHGQQPSINPPGGLNDTCPADNYDGGLIMFADVLEYWLDLTGNAAGLTAGVNGYVGGGVGGVFYETKNGVHYPIAQNIENFQVQYNGDINDDGLLDGFQDWIAGWTLDQVSRIRQIRILLLGRTPNRFVSVSGNPTGGIHHYRRPLMANSPAAAADDLHRRFLLESVSNIRNLSLNLYNGGVR
jgi:type II secretory pathway pseudopilin PulG